MTTVFLDLDNTLIYSHRHAMTAPRRVAEMLNGAEQSYITRRTYEFFTAQRVLQVVPVTTRTLPQFQRLQSLMKDMGCRYALICNGAILLHDMEIDRSWYEETLTLAAGELPEIGKAESWLAGECGESATHSAEGLLVYAASPDPARTAEALRRHVDTGKVDVLFDHRKTYCIPKSLNKGAAIRRFSRRFGLQSSIAAGDSDFDLPMLEQADLAIVPEELRGRLKNKNVIAARGNNCFSDEICSILERIL